jgi:phospholipid/cholesterol/gamma-HCH transport system substrate-binding protein
LKFTKEIKAGLIALVSIVLLVIGINFLKGYSLFGGDNTYYSYFSNSGQLMVSSDVTLNGVIIGKVLDIQNIPKNPENRRVKIKFSISESDITLPKGTVVELGSLDLLKKGLIINYPISAKKGYFKSGDEIPGKMAADMFSQVKQYADPISQKLQSLILHIDGMVNSLSGVFDKNGSNEISQSIHELKSTIKNIGDLAQEIKSFVAEEKVQFAKIMDHVESITSNIKKSNEAVNQIIGNSKKITDDLVSADFKGTILEAQTTLKKLNFALEDINQGKGTLGKLVKDDKLYTELVETNNELQELVDDLQANPQRYIHISAFGRKNKGVELTNKQELKLKRILDSIPD